ncbi:MAG: hypothetical protein H0W65_03690 [Sphingomonas sp.]|uniref:hypothetical protein n=1 Tax=Sphingomonas sp. TaxID=28214 RepID=UPI0018404AAB|nr:hypothetical protein [Sphingomonas sp.]MBA3666808.1 hypothetical protein [Sphingomonas sp.]
MRYTNRLFYCPMGDHVIVQPRTNETLDGALSRLKRLARSYRTWGRSFRVEKKPDGILWWRVEYGKNTKLARWYASRLGDRTTIKENAGAVELAKAKATARHLKRKGEGAFKPYLESGNLLIMRIEPPREVPA